MKIIQSRTFENKVKKLSSKEKKALDAQVKKIIEDPSIGTEKKGDLNGVYIHKFKVHTAQYLLSYRYSKKVLELIMLGPHENYYKSLQNYIKGEPSISQDSQTAAACE